jgi:hypothetical protein
VGEVRWPCAAPFNLFIPSDNYHEAEDGILLRQGHFSGAQPVVAKIKVPYIYENAKKHEG